MWIYLWYNFQILSNKLLNPMSFIITLVVWAVVQLAKINRKLRLSTRGPSVYGQCRMWTLDGNTVREWERTMKIITPGSRDSLRLNLRPGIYTQCMWISSSKQATTKRVKEDCCRYFFFFFSLCRSQTICFPRRSPWTRAGGRRRWAQALRRGRITANDKTGSRNQRHYYTPVS